MKKLIYSLIIITVSLIGIQKVDAAVYKAHCVYDGVNSKTIVVDVQYDPVGTIIDPVSLEPIKGKVNVTYESPEGGLPEFNATALNFEKFLNINAQKMACLPILYYSMDYDEITYNPVISLTSIASSYRKEAKLNASKSTADNIISKDQTSDDNVTTSDRYTYLLKNLIVPLKNIDSSILNQQIKINGEMVTLSSLGEGNELCATSDCDGKAAIKLDEGMKNIARYCENVFEKKASEERKEECMYFVKEFQDTLVSNDIVKSYTSDCGFLSNDIVEKLKSVLTIFSIAAPLLAIGLGTVDFIKVIVGGDADKDMKNAGKRLLTRLIAAILLLVVPTIIAFLLDAFLGNSEGYDPDNPFCNIVDKWGDE